MRKWPEVSAPAQGSIGSREFQHTLHFENSFGAERATYRLERIREPHLLTNIAQSNTNHVSASSAGRRYVVLDWGFIDLTPYARWARLPFHALAVLDFLAQAFLWSDCPVFWTTSMLGGNGGFQCLNSTTPQMPVVWSWSAVAVGVLLLIHAAYPVLFARLFPWVKSSNIVTNSSPPAGEHNDANGGDLADADDDKFHEMGSQLQITREAVRTWNSKTQSYSHLRSRLVALEVKLGALGIATPPVLGLGPIPLFTDDEIRINQGVWVAFLDVVIPLSQIRDLGSAKERYPMASAGKGDEAFPVHIPNSEQQRPASPSVQDESHVRIGIISGTEGGFTITNIDMLDVTIAYVDFTLGIPAGEEGTKGYSTSPEARIVRDNEEVKLPQRLRYGDIISVYYANHFLMCGQRLQPTALDTNGQRLARPVGRISDEWCRGLR